MKHIFFLMTICFVLLLTTSVFAENQLRLTLHATGTDIVPHVSWGAWVVRPDVLAHAKDADTVFSPIAFAVVGTHFEWRWRESMISVFWVEVLGGGTLMKEDFVPAGDVRSVLVSRYAHVYAETLFNEKVFASSLAAEFPVTWDGKMVCKLGGEYDASYPWDSGTGKKIVRLGPRFSVPVGPLLLALTLDPLDDPRIYAVLNLPF